MTDREVLYLYRLRQAEETLSEAERMLQEDFSSRSITNRAYYAMFYAVLALFLKTGVNIKTSKHVGIISIFDKEFVRSGKLDKYYSRILHDAFDDRQEADYKELAEIPVERAAEHVQHAGFIRGLKGKVDNY
jgi:uncharacterized protein (UPF0332 family)